MPSAPPAGGRFLAGKKPAGGGAHPRDPRPPPGARGAGRRPGAAGGGRGGGEWNLARIVASGNHVEHWLNGQKVVEYELLSPEWEALVKASKFVEWPDYGRAKPGHIAPP